jgi:hypothetical protein
MHETQSTQRDIEWDQYNADCMFQQAAPLQYIDDEEMAQLVNHASFRKTSHFVADFMDRRTQAQMVSYPWMSLNLTNVKQPTKYAGSQGSYGPKPQFRTAWGDPNSAANTGGLIGLVSGGLISRPRNNKDDKSDSDDDKKEKKKKKKKKSKGIIGTARGSIMGQQIERDKPVGPIKELKRRTAPNRDALYLLIAVKE